MTNEVQATETTQPSQAKTISDPDLSFADYQKLRRGEEVKVVSAPVEKPEQKKPANSETAETEEEESDESESDGDELEAADESEKDKPKKKGGFQRRIDKLNARAAAAERRAEEAEARLAASNKPALDEPKKVDAKNNQDGKPNPEDFETHAEYMEKLTDWKLDQRESKAKAEAEKSRLMSEQEKVFKAHLEREKSFIDKTDDYAEVMEDANFLKDASITLQDLIVSSELGPELMYELAKDQAEYKRINALSPLSAAREIGKLELKLSKPSEPKTEPKKLTSAPKPIEPVGKGKGAIAKSIDDPNISFSDYERLRKQQMKRRG